MGGVSVIEHEALIEEFLVGVRAGMGNTGAALRVGISPDTVKNWIQKARDSPSRPDTDGIYSEFVAKLNVAKATAEFTQLQNVQAAASSPHGRGWGAATWLLSKLNPKRFGDKIEISGEIEHRKTYRFLAPEVPEPGAPRSVAAEVVQHAIEPPEEPDAPF